MFNDFFLFVSRISSKIIFVKTENYKIHLETVFLYVQLYIKLGVWQYMSTTLKILLNYGQTPPKSLTSFAFFITMDLIISLPVTQGLILQGLKIECKYLGPYI